MTDTNIFISPNIFDKIIFLATVTWISYDDEYAEIVVLFIFIFISVPAIVLERVHIINGNCNKNSLKILLITKQIYKQKNH